MCVCVYVYMCSCMHTHSLTKAFIFSISLLQRIANIGGLKFRRVMGLER